MARTSARTAGVAGASVAAVVAVATPLVMAWEGLRLDPYKDVANINTVCWGQTNVEMRRYTRAECDVMLGRSLMKHAGPVLDCLPADAPIEVKAAFVSFGYNVGVTSACGSAAARQARSADYARACVSLGNWVFAGGKRVQGLVNRRKAETELCLRGVTPGHLSDAEL